MSNLTLPAAEWLAQLFECEYCAECGGDAQHHTAVPFNGNWFARCDFSPPDDGETLHPTIAAYRREVEAENARLAAIPRGSL
jgi:hypothetical protein